MNCAAETCRVVVKYGDDAVPETVARGVDFAGASTASAAHPWATRFVIGEKTETVAATYRPYPPCGLCGERTTEDDQAEMFDPKSEPGPDGVHPAVICHPECGLARGLEVA